MRDCLICRVAASLLVSACLLPAPLYAQDNRALMDKIDKLERDILTVQRQVARGEPVSLPGGGIDTGNARQEVKITELEEELKRLRGRVEESEFKSKKVADDLARFQKDMEFRLNALEQQKSAEATASQESLSKPAAEDGASAEVHEIKDEETVDNSVKPDETLGEESVDDSATPRDLYNKAFRLLNQTRYADASVQFETFTTKYPKDPLIGNAYYWLGETYYIRRDYVKAADNFRQGFEVLPAGPKAADNLLKLSMSLSALKKNKEACVVLDQILVKFKEKSAAVAQKAESERTRIGCQ